MSIPIVRKVLEKNERAAEENRALFAARGWTCVNILGGAGCGKTTLLEAVIPRLRESCHIAVLEGDLATTRDAERIDALGVPVVQLLTDGGCHLTAIHVSHALDHLAVEDVDLLLIENVGNPVCPANFDLGEHARIALLSVTDGDDKPSKYPLLFRTANLVVLSKSDLLPAVNFNTEAVSHDVHRINPSVEIVLTNTASSEGFDTVTHWIRSLDSLRARCGTVSVH